MTRNGERGSRQINVRFDIDSWTRLNTIAADTDRPVSQLVRYAVNDFLDSDTPVTATVSDQPLPRHVNVRFDSAVADRLDARAAANNITASDVVRAAVRAWLAATDLSRLGTPAAAKGGDH